MRREFDLGSLSWQLSGWTPELWRLFRTMELGECPSAEIPGIAARVPGSVQQALRDAGLLPDWTLDSNWRACEWVEHRHWIYETILPGAWFGDGCEHELVFEGLDYAGWVYVDDTLLGEFRGTHTPHRFQIPPGCLENRRLRVVFDLPPRWLGQFGFTSRVTEFKARFNYTWDWVPRLVQTGFWDRVRLVQHDGNVLGPVFVRTDFDSPTRTGALEFRASAPGAAADARIRLTLTSCSGRPVASRTLSVADARSNCTWDGLSVDAWWPNLEGAQVLYLLEIELLDASGALVDVETRRLGFRRIRWEACEGAPAEADPWLCVVNDRPVFLQGVNFPPLLPFFADATLEQYRRLLHRYHELGANMFRVNGVGHLERTCFYDLCDELGILVWQDLPLSSSGIENLPPQAPEAIADMKRIFDSYIERRGHHACLACWCGGNELQETDEQGRSVPVARSHPMIEALARTAAEADPGRRFMPTTALGPRFNADAAEFGQGLHWNVHGPWKLPGSMAEWEAYWTADDSLFRAETGCPGTASAAAIRSLAVDLDPMPVSGHNPLWRRPLTWWVEDAVFEHETGRAPSSLEEYVAWSQARQARALEIAVSACKRRFPRCGGILLWCGHDAFPCPANTSILDWNGDPKPAALA
jgi:beta-mannosidase